MYNPIILLTAKVTTDLTYFLTASSHHHITLTNLVQRSFLHIELY